MAKDSPKVEMAQARTSGAGAASMSDNGLNLYQEYHNWREVSNLGGGQFTAEARSRGAKRRERENQILLRCLSPRVPPRLRDSAVKSPSASLLSISFSGEYNRNRKE